MITNEDRYNCTYCHDTGRKFSDCHHCNSVGFVTVAAFKMAYNCDCSNYRCIKCGKAGPHGAPVVPYHGEEPPPNPPTLRIV